MQCGPPNQNYAHPAHAAAPPMTATVRDRCGLTAGSLPGVTTSVAILTADVASAVDRKKNFSLCMLSEQKQNHYWSNRII